MELAVVVGRGRNGRGALRPGALPGLAHDDADLVGVDLEHVVGRRHRAAHSQRRDRAGVHDAHAGDAPHVWDVAVSGQHEVYAQFAQDRHDVAGVAEVVDVAAGPGTARM